MCFACNLFRVSRGTLLLRSEEAVMMFPEAGRSDDGRLQRFRGGTFRLACSLGVPIMPVTIIGGHESWPSVEGCPGPAASPWSITT